MVSPAESSETAPREAAGAEEDRSHLARSSAEPDARASHHGEHLNYVAQLQAAGLLSDLTDAMLHVLEEAVEHGPKMHRQTADQRAVSLLHAYYAAAGDEDARTRRAGQDRFFLHADADLVDAHGVVERLNALVPEIEELALERIGGGSDGPLVLRCGEDFSAVTDDYEEDLEADDIDLRELDVIETVSVRGLVSALNGLLARTSFDRRFILLRSDGTREVFVAVQPECARNLLHAGLLHETSEGWLQDFCAL